MKRKLCTLVVMVFVMVALATRGIAAGSSGSMVYVNGNWRYSTNGRIDYSYTGMACNDYGWWYFQNGQLDWDYTGMASNDYGWWYFQNGQLDWDYTGMACNAYGWWYFQNGQLDWDYTGMACNDYGWWYFQNGELNMSYTGMACNDYGWWYFEDGFLSPEFKGIGTNDLGKWYYMNGTIDWNYTGMFKDIELGWAFIRQGMVDEHYTGVAYNENGTWYFEDGHLQNGESAPTKTGMVQDPTGTWLYMKHGKIDKTFSGMAENEYGWFYYNNGTVDFSYNGVGRNDYGAWYFENGEINFNYAGDFTDGEITYQVEGGRAKAKESSNLLLGVFFNSREDSSDTLYVSFDGYDFYSLGEAYHNINDTVDGDDLADCSPSIQVPDNPYWSGWNVYTQRDPSIFYKDGYFWMTGTARGEQGGPNSQKMIPMLAYSKNLKDWSYPCAGESSTINYNQQDNWLLPQTTPPATNAQGGYDAVAGDAFVDDDGTVWFVVSTGAYMDSHTNQLAPYLIKITDLQVPDNAQLDTTLNKCQYSNFNVTYGPMEPINLPTEQANAINKTWDHADYDYDGSLFKRDGKYYYVVQHSGEFIQMWSIDSLDNVSDRNAWELVSPEVLEGSEGPCIAQLNGKNYLYADRYPGWDFNDMWGNNFGIFATTANTLSNSGTQYTDTVRINTTGKNGKIPCRHGSVIRLTDQNAIQTVLDAYHGMGY